MRRLKAGETRIVANAAVLTEGFDEPSIDLVVMARPTRSSVLFAQCIGRGTRKYPGKADLLVLDVVGATHRLDLVTTGTLFGLSPEAVEQKGVAEAAAEREAEEERQRNRIDASGKLIAKTVDLFRRRPMVWTPSPGADVFVLSLGDGNLLLTREAGSEDRWRVVEVRRVQRPGLPFPMDSTQVLAEGLPLAYAQGTAEDRVREVGATVLNRKDARWRREPATEKQVARLVRWGLWRDGLTKGDAADLISGRIAEQTARRVAP